jgi:hypothetical protein
LTTLVGTLRFAHPSTLQFAIVVTGLDPVIHPFERLLRRLMDARIKSGHDECVSWGRFAHSHFDFQIAKATSNAPPHSRGAMRPGFAWMLRPEKSEGVGNAGCAMHPQPRVQM